MSATTMSVAHAKPHTPPSLERLSLVLLLVFVGALQIQISIAQILLTASLLCWAATTLRDRARPAVPPFFGALVAYGAATLVAAAFSIEPITSIVDSKQLVLFVIVPLVYNVARGRATSTAVDVMLSVGAAGAAFGIVQYGILHYDSLGQRPQGTLTHYMTYSGVLMLVICAAVARLLFGTRDRVWAALVMPALVVALLLTLTRNAWIGAAIGVGLLFALKDVRLTALLPVGIVLMSVVAPGLIAQRMASTFNAEDPANQDRLAMIEIGARMVVDHPLTGVGPNMVPLVYEEYRPEYAVNPTNPHLHNVPLQIAAERGLPALAIWIWFLTALTVRLFRLFRQQQDKVLPATGLAAVAAMLTAGLFEYNFGDSEFLMLFLVLVTLPFAAARGSAPSTVHAPATDHA